MKCLQYIDIKELNGFHVSQYSTCIGLLGLCTSDDVRKTLTRQKVRKDEISLLFAKCEDGKCVPDWNVCTAHPRYCVCRNVHG